MYICNMRKYFVFAAAALVVLAACQKKGSEVANQAPETSVTTVPAWVDDESLPVPIEMGKHGLMATKGGGEPVSAAKFAESAFRYSVIALRKSDGEVMEGFDGGVLARNIDGDEDAATGDDLTGNTVVQFLDNNGQAVTKYYPYMYADGQFNFYGYRVDGNPQHQQLEGTTIRGIEMGPYDLLWAESKALAADETAARTGNAGVGRDYESNGFSARYIRGVRRAYVDGTAQGMQNYVSALPHLEFKHITSQLQFFIKAFDDIAEKTLAAANVTVSSITIGGTDAADPDIMPIAQKTNFDVATGDLSQDTPGTITVEEDEINDNLVIDQNGTQCCNPLFIMPHTGKILLTMELTLPTGDTQTIKTPLAAPAIPTADPPIPAGTFAAGYVYKFTVSLESIEKINIVTTLLPWGDTVEADPIVID